MTPLVPHRDWKDFKIKKTQNMLMEGRKGDKGHPVAQGNKTIKFYKLLFPPQPPMINDRALLSLRSGPKACVSVFTICF